jgi:ATP-dependent helicase HepA
MRFVISSDPSVRGYGYGRQDPDEDPSRIEYFISPAEERWYATVDPATIRAVKLEREEQIYFQDAGSWQFGRLQEYVDEARFSLKLPNDEWREVDTSDAFVRSNLPLRDPLGLLQARTTLTPFWHTYRTGLVRAIAEQRACYRGLIGLASANVEIFAHQVLVVQRVLKDPVLRYLLADEVGLGKTIEAATIIRQHILDEMDIARVVILVPDNLVKQWQAELETRFHLHIEIDAQNEIGRGPGVRVLGHGEVARLSTMAEPATLLVIDEAHEISRNAFNPRERQKFEIVSESAKLARGVLLMSATPVLHNEDAFLAMLHLLDPQTYDLRDRDAFRDKIRHRDVVSQAVSDLSSADSFPVQGALELLAPLAGSTPLLRQKIAELEGALDDLHEPRHAELVKALRSYLQESFRLDRRLLRTRRTHDDVTHDLPKRRLEHWCFEDPVRRAIYDWLDAWRFSASGRDQTDACKRVFLEFFEAALMHPTLLVCAAAERRIAIRAGKETELFEGELGDLEKVTAPPVSEDPRLLALLDRICADIPRKKWVVFASDPAIASALCAGLRKKLFDGVMLVGEGASSGKVVSDFRENQRIVVLVCDRSGEQGLNLQGMDARIVHFDIPLSANRVEQRIGRLDRIGGNQHIVSMVPGLGAMPSSRTYEDAWAECLASAVKVFNRSVASLQHMLDEGVEAIDDLAHAWGDEGPLSLRVESRRVDQQAMLDQIEMIEGVEEDLSPPIEEYEYGEAADRFAEAVNKWATRALRFRRHNRTDDKKILEYEHVDGHDHPTLLAMGRLWMLLPDAFKSDRRRDGLHTQWLDFNRLQAAKNGGVPIARVGHPFIDGLRQLMEFDERGRAYALWRKVDDFQARFPGTGSEGLFFRFDFLVEANLEAVELLAQQRGLSMAALARRAEEAFPPLYETVWVDIEGDAVTEAQLDELGRPYDRGNDTNLRGPRWALVDELGLFADWNEVCASAHRRAREWLEQRTELSRKIESAERHVESVFQQAKFGLDARIQAVAGRHGDRQILALEREIHVCLCSAFQPPTIRLDSVGAVVLADRQLRD